MKLRRWQRLRFVVAVLWTNGWFFISTGASGNTWSNSRRIEDYEWITLIVVLTVIFAIDIYRWIKAGDN